MTWKLLEAEILEMFGEASHARGHTAGATNQRALTARPYEFGELATDHHKLGTSKKSKVADAREFKALRTLNWKRAAKNRVVDTRACTICMRAYPVTAWARAYRKDSSCSPKCRRLANHPERLVRIGEERDTIAGWARRNGITERGVHYRVFIMKWELIRAITTPPTPRHLRTFKGSAAKVARAKDAGLCITTVRARMRDGMTFEQAIALPKKRAVLDSGSVAGLARAAGLNVRTVRKRRAKGSSLEEALAAPVIPFHLRRWAAGNDSLKAKSRAAGLPYHTVHRRVRGLGWSLERALSTPVRPHGPYSKGGT